MKAYIIQQKEFEHLHDKLKLEENNYKPGINTIHIVEKYKISEADQKILMEELHRRYNYILRTWISEQEK